MPHADSACHMTWCVPKTCSYDKDLGPKPWRFWHFHDAMPTVKMMHGVHGSIAKAILVVAIKAVGCCISVATQLSQEVETCLPAALLVVALVLQASL